MLEKISIDAVIYGILKYNKDNNVNIKTKNLVNFIKDYDKLISNSLYINNENTYLSVEELINDLTNIITTLEKSDFNKEISEDIIEDITLILLKLYSLN